MRLLRLATTLNSTSAPRRYNQFALGFKESIDQTFFSLLEHNIVIDKRIKAFHSNGSVLKMFKLVNELISKNKYDVIHIHSGLFTGLVFIFALFPFRLGY